MSISRSVVVLAVQFLWAGVGYSTELRVHLIYLKNGKPATNQSLLLFEGDPAKSGTVRLSGRTASDGVATFDLPNQLPEAVWIYTNNGQITTCAWQDLMPTRTVMTEGATIGADERFGHSCKGDRSLITRLAAKPGEIVIFVRAVTALNNIRHY
jgi:hypothetical protein